MNHCKLSSRCYRYTCGPAAARLRSCTAAPLHKQDESQHVNAAQPSVREWNLKEGSELLTRDFIAKSLYNQDNGYFSTKDVINELPGPLEFRNMMGELHYRMDVKQAYESKLSAWMTPVETFSPHFSHALARFIAQETKNVSAKPPASSAQAKLPRHLRRIRGPAATRGRREESLVLYEGGGGTGTNALNVLDWLRREEPKLYERTEYTIIEISPRLAELQRERVCTIHENCRVINANVLEWGMSGEADHRPCVFMGMELLDNLPHDKIAWTAPSRWEVGRGNGATNFYSTSSPNEKGDNEQQLCEAVVIETPEDGFREVFRPLRDPTIRELLNICPELAAAVRNRREPSSSYRTESKSPSLGRKIADIFGTAGGYLGGLGGSGALPRPEHNAAFVPTGSLKLMKALRRRLPRHRTILADFDSFAGSTEADSPGGSGEAAARAAPGTGNDDDSLLAFQSPIVSSRNPLSGGVTDHSTYLVPLGSADIFFPTCFERLSRVHAAVCRSSTGGTDGDIIRRGRGLVVKQGEFLREFADLDATRTFSGFNPLVDDFRNSSVFLSGAVLDS